MFVGAGLVIGDGSTTTRLDVTRVVRAFIALLQASLFLTTTIGSLTGAKLVGVLLLREHDLADTATTTRCHAAVADSV